MFEAISLLSHSAAAILFGALTFWLSGRGMTDRALRPMAVACAMTAIWGLTVAIDGPTSLSALVAENIRNISWLGFMYILWRQGEGDQRTFTVAALYGVLGLVVTATSAIDLMPATLAGSPRWLNAAFFVSIVLRMTVSVGALVLVHNLYTAATRDARSAIRLPMIALSVMWGYDLNLLTVSYLFGDWSGELLALRGVAMALIAPLFGLTAQRSENFAVKLSRTATFQSLSLVAIGGYLMVMVLITSLIQAVAGDHARAAQVSFVFGTSVAALLLLPSARFRAWFRVKLSKHLFQHRYDYRAEWLRFTDTIGRPGDEATSIHTRIVKAISDITESPGGILLVPDDQGALIPQARWNAASIEVPAHAASAEAGRYFLSTGRIVEVDTIRASEEHSDEDAAILPEWLLGEHRAWVIVPLVYFDRLAGLVILERPTLDRTLDWEDFDLLRVVGRQVSSYLAEARGQEALADAQQFDEFNRRFAFIMHDIKNLVSQLSLVTRNAEKHAGNPDFQADMIATLKNSTARMNDLLARLSQHNKVRAEDPKPIDASPLIERVAAAKRIAHPIVISGESRLFLVADPARLEQALLHLVQNAIDASPSIEPVTIAVRQIEGDAVIEVRDHGAGMSSHFVRHSLFKPFASTKDGGFGIGAFEARSLVAAMGGTLDVTSREGEGSVFRITLPIARENPFTPAEQAMVA
jgi:putative PEP-CTERM system histidine kinase